MCNVWLKIEKYILHRSNVQNPISKKARFECQKFDIRQTADRMSKIRHSIGPARMSNIRHSTLRPIESKRSDPSMRRIESNLLHSIRQNAHLYCACVSPNICNRRSVIVSRTISIYLFIRTTCLNHNQSIIAGGHIIASFSHDMPWISPHFNKPQAKTDPKAPHIKPKAWSEGCRHNTRGRTKFSHFSMHPFNQTIHPFSPQLHDWQRLTKFIIHALTHLPPPYSLLSQTCIFNMYGTS